MGHTNETTNLHLPQFIGSDKPTWLGDINGAFQSIDSAYATIEASASGAISTANNAASVAQSAATEAASATTTAQSAATDAATAISTANNAAETANNAQSTAVLAKNEADEALAAVNRGNVSVTADGVKTYGALLNEINTNMVASKISNNAVISINNILLRLDYNGNEKTFHTSRIHTSNVTFNEIRISANSTYYNAVVSASNVTVTEISSEVPASGLEITLYY